MNLNGIRHLQQILLPVFALALIACSGGSGSNVGTPANSGAVNLAFAVSASDITKVEAVITADDINPAIVEPLELVNGFATGTILGIAAGSNRLITANAYEGGIVACTGSESVDVLEGQTVEVMIVLQCGGSDTPQGNVTIDGELNFAPEIDSLYASTLNVGLGETTLFRVRASDVDGDTVTAAWSSTCGSFSAPAQFETNWTAPLERATCTVTITVSDGRGGSDSYQFDMTVAVSSSTTTPKIMGVEYYCVDATTMQAVVHGGNFANGDGSLVGATLSIHTIDGSSSTSHGLDTADGAPIHFAGDSNVEFGSFTAADAGSETRLVVSNDRGDSVPFRTSVPDANAICGGSGAPYINAVLFICSGSQLADMTLYGGGFDSMDGTFTNSTSEMLNLTFGTSITYSLDSSVNGGTPSNVTSSSFTFVGADPNSAGFEIRFTVVNDRGTTSPGMLTIPDVAGACP